MNKKIFVFIIFIFATGLLWHFYPSQQKEKFLLSSTKVIKQIQNIRVSQEVQTQARHFQTKVAKIFTAGPLQALVEDQNSRLTNSGVIKFTNLNRSGNGQLTALSENSLLDASAAYKLQDMFKKQYFEHISPSGVDPGTLVKSFGYDYIASGENLILGNFVNEKEVVQDWMDSPGHRANILNNRFADIGVAIVKGTYKGRVVWIGVQEFGLPLSACPAPWWPGR